MYSVPLCLNAIIALAGKNKSYNDNEDLSISNRMSISVSSTAKIYIDSRSKRE